MSDRSPALGTRQVFVAIRVMAAVVLLGGAGYYALGRGGWTFAQALYMSIITVCTVGFAELPGFDEVPGARAWTIAVILAGIAAVAYFQSTLTALLIEGTIGHAWRRARMKKQIAAMSGHVVLAGVGSTGRHVAEELQAAATPFVAIDRNSEHLERLASEFGAGFSYVHGDATDDDVLREAGANRASGIVTTLNDDKANVFVTLSARSMNPTARIVARVIEVESKPKMVRAGANATVSPNAIGGRRMASELLRPEATAFFDEMFRDNAHLRFDEIGIGSNSRYSGRPLADLARDSDADVMILGVKCDDRLQHNPPSTLVLKPGATLLVLGDGAEVGKLRAKAGSPG